MGAGGDHRKKIPSIVCCTVGKTMLCLLITTYDRVSSSLKSPKPFQQQVAANCWHTILCSHNCYRHDCLTSVPPNGMLIANSITLWPFFRHFMNKREHKSHTCHHFTATKQSACRSDHRITGQNNLEPILGRLIDTSLTSLMLFLSGEWLHFISSLRW